MGAAAPIALAVGGGMLSAHAKGEAGKAQSNYYSYLAGTENTNAALAETGAEIEAKSIGDQAADEFRRMTENTRRVRGSQKAALVGGVGAGSKTAEQISNDTSRTANLDEMALLYNSQMKQRNARLGGKMAALNARTKASGYELAGRNAMDSARLEQASSLLGSTGSVAGMWYK